LLCVVYTNASARIWQHGALLSTDIDPGTDSSEFASSRWPRLQCRLEMCWMDGKYVLAYLDATPVKHPNRGAELSAKRRTTHLGNLTSGEPGKLLKTWTFREIQPAMLGRCVVSSTRSVGVQRS